MKNKIPIYPSLISGNLLRLFDQIKLLEPYCAGFHIDVMDFHFVPNLTWGPQFINQIRKATNKQLFIHLMVDNPEKYLDILKLNDNDMVAFHIESLSDLSKIDRTKPNTHISDAAHNKSIIQLIKLIKAKNWIPCIALNPDTPLEAILNIKIPVENILLMSVKPGFSGQKFISASLNRLIELNNFRKIHNLSV